MRASDRFSQPSYALLERLFLFDLWSKGVCYGNFKTDDPRKMAEVIGAFVVGRASIDEPAAYSLTWSRRARISKPRMETGTALARLRLGEVSVIRDTEPNRLDRYSKRVLSRPRGWSMLARIRERASGPPPAGGRSGRLESWVIASFVA